MTNTLCHNVTNDVTNTVSHTCLTPLVTHAQNQNQNQTVFKSLCGVSGQVVIHLKSLTEGMNE